MNKIAYKFLGWFFLVFFVGIGAYRLLIGVHTTHRANWVTLDISTCTRVVVPEIIVMQPRFGIEVLSGK